MRTWLEISSKSSILGLHDINEQMPNNFYPLPKQSNSVANDLSAFDCMMSGLGDVAFVNLKNIEEKTGSSTQNRNSQTRKKAYRTLCFNEIDTDEVCLLAWAPLSAIIAHENITDLRREEINSMLLEMDKLFGHTFKGQTPAFSMYGVYDTNRSIIFPEETQHLQIKVHQIQRVRSYGDIIDDLAKQSQCSGAKSLNFYYNKIIFIPVFIVFLSKALNE